MIFKRHSKKKTDKKKLDKLLHSQLAANCIFFKNPIVCFGQLEDFQVDETGIEISITSIPTPGLETPQESLKLSSNLDDLAFSPLHLLSYDRGWHLFFKAELIEKVRNTAAQYEQQEDKLLQMTDILLNYVAEE
ncbi:MAG: hypothetical protein JSW33_07140 [bacterium]|nr:MAG: hypothetical protein JSW33_07140 [bacterium]